MRLQYKAPAYTARNSQPQEQIEKFDYPMYDIFNPYGVGQVQPYQAPEIDGGVSPIDPSNYDSTNIAPDLPYGMGEMQFPPQEAEELSRAIAGFYDKKQNGQNMPMSNASKKNFDTQGGKDLKDRDKMRDKLAEYFRKREDLASDTRNRMEKLDRQFAGQGPDLSGLAAFGDMLLPSGVSAQKFYQQYKPMGETEMEMLKQKLQDKEQGGYERLSKDYMTMERDAAMREQYKAGNKLREKAIQDKGMKPLSGEAIKRMSFVMSMDRGVKGMKDLIRDHDFGKLYRAQTQAGLSSNYVKDTKLATYIRSVAESYGRMQSGGAIQQEEAKRFVMEMFKTVENKETFMRKLDQLQIMVDDRRKLIQSGGHYYPDIKTGEGAEAPTNLRGGLTRDQVKNLSNEDYQAWKRTVGNE